MPPRRRTVERSHRPPTTRPRSPLAIDVLLAAACALLAVWTQRRMLGGFFSPDDLISLERARGLIPQPDRLWRLLSQRVYFDAAVTWFGARAPLYFGLHAALHAIDVALLYALARRWGGSRPAAVVVAGLFGTSRLLATSLGQVVGIEELLAVGLTLAAFLAATSSLRLRSALATALFLAALLCKETVIGLPLVLLVVPGTWRERLARAAPLIAASAVLGLFLLASGAQTNVFGGSAYSMRIGPQVFHNLSNYAAWLVDYTSLEIGRGGASPTAWRIGVPVLVALLTVAWLARASTLVRAGIVWAALAIAPVLPLLNHTYLHYLHIPLIGIAMVLGGAVDSTLARARGSTAARPAVALGAAFAVVVVSALVANALLGARVNELSKGVDIPFDTQLRKAALARNAFVSLADALGDQPTRLVIVTPLEGMRRVNVTRGDTRSLPNATVESSLQYKVLDGGRALRALYPQLDSVAIVPAWTPRYRDFDLCTNAANGSITDLGRGPRAHAEFAVSMLREGWMRTARDHLSAALVIFPDDLLLRYLRAEAFAGLGDLGAAAGDLNEVLRRDPVGRLAEPARKRLDEIRQAATQAAEARKSAGG